MALVFYSERARRARREAMSAALKALLLALALSATWVAARHF
jgi:hypothetical protein